MALERKRPLNLIGFVVTILIATAILIAGIVAWIQNGHFGMSLPGLSFKNGVSSSLICVANILAYLLAIFTGLSYARSRRNIMFLILQVIASVIIVFVIITSLF
ncbi:MAG: hypothetical protein IJ837_01200 [Clostridia bacterium]|nr:hypothetical protein [Clostridia bacterium]